jgi:hypothetical protein
MNSSKTLNLVIGNRSTGATISNHLTKYNTEFELIVLAKIAIKNGMVAKVWDLAKLDPIFEG